MLKFNVGQTYICTETKMRYWTVGKEYPVQLRTGINPCIVDDEGVGWYPDAYEMYATFKLKETSSFKKYGKLRFSMDELPAEKEKAVDRKYTPFEVNKVIIKAYQLYDNDSQRLAYIKGYFAK